MKLKAVLAFLIIFIVTFSVQFTYANVPELNHLGASREGDNVEITVEMEHSEWSETHYVDIVEVTVDGKTLNFTDLEPQNALRFSLNGTINNAEIRELGARAHCTTNGWSNWTYAAQTSVVTADRALPEEPTWYPLVALLTMVSLFVLMRWRKMIP